MWFSPPGNQDYRSLEATARNPMRFAVNTKELRYRDFVEKGYVISGSPATVRQRLQEEVVKGLRVGNLMVLLQIGSMPHELTLQNMDLFAREVLPVAPPGFWEDEGWVNHWWPEKLRKRAPEALPVRGAAGSERASDGSPGPQPLSRLAEPRPHARALEGQPGPPSSSSTAPGACTGIRSSTPWPSTSPCTPPSIPAPRPARPTTSITWTASGT